MGHWPAEHLSSFGNAADMYRLGTDQTSREYLGDPPVRQNNQPIGSVRTRKPHSSFGRFSQKVIVRLFLDRAAFLRNSLVPIIRICELRIDVKYHTPKGMLLVPDNLAQMIFCTNS